MSIFTKRRDKVKVFEERTKNSTGEEKRSIEEQLLKPEEIPTYPGKTPKNKSELESRTALIVFRDKAEMDLIGELFSIRHSVSKETYITDISLLSSIAQSVREGAMEVVDNQIMHTFSACVDEVQKVNETCIVYASEIEFQLEVPVKKIKKVAKKIYKKPHKYADVGKGESAYYNFLKYLYIQFPDKSELRLVDYVENTKKGN